ncbi:MAG: hypothetical protein R3B72_51400 [Polyangiaceae bacterium]
MSLAVATTSPRRLSVTSSSACAAEGTTMMSTKPGPPSSPILATSQSPAGQWASTTASSMGLALGSSQ